MNDCLFCKIVKGEIPSYKVYEDDEVYSFLSIGPANLGHTLVIPKKHSENALSMSPDEFSELSKRINTIAKGVKSGTSADGINISFNNGEAAGQEEEADGPRQEARAVRAGLGH
ncbi:hypothetical protein COB52_02460, partial [Candidatus Kaiserbacteria bacterium]